MKSIFLKNFIIYSLVVMLSFTALGGAFVYQVNKYANEEKESTLNNTAKSAAEATRVYVETKVYWSTNPNGALFEAREAQQYRMNITQLAGSLGGLIFICDNDGNLQFFATGDGCYVQENSAIPPAAVQALKQNDRYYEVGNFSGMLSSTHYTLGVPVKTNDTTIASVFISLPSDSAMLKLFMNISSTFILMIFIVFLLVLAVTYVMVDSTVRPLKNIAAAAKRFGRGDFACRVAVPKRRDELYALTISFNNMADAIQNMEKQRRDLIGNVSHDLRTPMTTIGGFIDGILDGTIKPARQNYYLEIVSEEIKRLSRLANSMLEVSRLENGETKLNRTTFDFSEMVRRIAIGFEQKLSEHKIEINLDLPDHQNINADHDAIFQVAYNLIDNAVKFTNDGGAITICIVTKGSNLQFNIVNTGAGIAPEDIKRIFDRFYKGDRSRNSKVTSSGLGLYIVKTIVGRHGGDIFAKSDDSKTEFCFTIPIHSGTAK